jgi:hypothetical protein
LTQFVHSWRNLQREIGLFRMTAFNIERINDSGHQRLKAGFGLADAGETDVAAEDGQGFKERGRVSASADGDSDGLEGLPGLQTKV